MNLVNNATQANDGLAKSYAYLFCWEIILGCIQWMLTYSKLSQRGTFNAGLGDGRAFLTTGKPLDTPIITY